MLAEALDATNALDTLELPSCGIGAAGARSLARAVDESNFNLLQLNLRGAQTAAPRGCRPVHLDKGRAAVYVGISKASAGRVPLVSDDLCQQLARYLLCQCLVR